MSFLQSKRFVDYTLLITKIAIIGTMAVFLLGFYFPFFEYPNDSKVYGYLTLQIAEGEYEYTNELLQKTGYWEFVPSALVKTHDNSAIPNILPLFPVIGAFIFKIFGHSGLFYLNPILTVLFLVISERLATKYFNKYVGLLVLIFLSTNEMTFWVGRGLLTSMIFSIFFIVGIHFLLKFLKTKSELQILLSSICFTLAVFIRPNGIIFIPVEIFVVVSYFIFERLIKKNTISKLSWKKISKITTYMIGPGLVFVIFMLLFNVHYFGEPTTTMYNVPGAPRHFISELNVDAFSINTERVEKYSGHFLPYPINRVAAALNYGETSASTEFDGFITSLKEISLLSHIGLSTFVIIGLALFISWRYKRQRLDCSVYAIFIMSLILFYSIQLIVVGRQGSPRDMLPLYPIFYALLGYVIVNILKKSTFGFPQKKSAGIKSVKIILIIGLVIFIPVSFAFADYSQIIKKNGFNDLRDPIKLASDYYDTSYTISEKDVVVTFFEFDRVIDHGSIPFTPMGWQNKEFNSQNPIYVEMINKLDGILNEDERNVFVFKNPHLEHEKKFHNYLDSTGKYIFSDYSQHFCQLELKNHQKDVSDNVCLN